MAKFTVPAFDDTNAGTISASIVTIPPTSIFRPLRVTGENIVFLHAVKPTTEAEHLNGWPLGPNADEPLLGEALPQTMESGGYNTLYVTAVAASEVRTLDVD